MRFFKNILFLIFFWIVFIPVRIFTLLLRIIGFKHWKKRKAGTPRSVLYLAAFFPENAGYHYRVLKWADVLRNKGVRVDIRSVFCKAQFDDLWYHNRKRLYIYPIIRRFFHCLSAPNYDIVIVRRELLLFTDYGNQFMEKFLSALHSNLILDFDDDIAAAKQEDRKVTWFGRLLLEHPGKFTSSLSYYDKFIVGSAYLKGKLMHWQPDLDDRHIVVVPTCVDYETQPSKHYSERNDATIFGWIGGNANLPLLDLVVPSLERLAQDHPIKLVVISGRDYAYHGPLEIENIRWGMDSQVNDLLKTDIGLMPLPDNAVSKGKCGFKLIQYMGLGMVSIASAITANKEILDDGVNGFLVEPEADWKASIEKVMQERDRFAEIGRLAREKINARYSFRANERAYLDFL